MTQPRHSTNYAFLTPLQQRMEDIAIKNGTPWFILEATHHPFNCDCEACFEYGKYFFGSPASFESSETRFSLEQLQGTYEAYRIWRTGQ